MKIQAPLPPQQMNSNPRRMQTTPVCEWTGLHSEPFQKFANSLVQEWACQAVTLIFLSTVPVPGTVATLAQRPKRLHQPRE